MIDYHCHLLPGLDDGPAGWDEALEMARSLAAFGFREVCCTPHCIKGHYEFSPVEIRDAVRRMQARLDGEGIALRLHPGMEYYLDSCFEQFAANLLPLGESRLVLCEAPPQVHAGVVAAALELVVVQGFVPLVAHPERSEVIWEMLEEEQEDRDKTQEARGEGQDAKTTSWWHRIFPSRGPAGPDDAGRLRSLNAMLPSSGGELPEGCLFQANLGSFTGYYGPKPQRRAYELLQRGVYTCLASDLHEAAAAGPLFEAARDKLDFNPALQRLGDFVAPQGKGGSNQMAFW